MIRLVTNRIRCNISNMVFKAGYKIHFFKIFQMNVMGVNSCTSQKPAWVLNLIQFFQSMLRKKTRRSNYEKRVGIVYRITQELAYLSWTNKYLTQCPQNKKNLLHQSFLNRPFDFFLFIRITIPAMIKNTMPTAPRIVSISNPLLISKSRNASHVYYETVEGIDQTPVLVKLRFL